MASHYSNVQQAAQLSIRADAWAKELIKRSSKRGLGQVIAPILVYTGLSGIGSATALSLALHKRSKGEFKFGMIYVRKPNEKSHGSQIERNLDDLSGIRKLTHKLVFVDDFISSGTSYARAMITVVLHQYRDTIGQKVFDASKTWIADMTHSPNEQDLRITESTFKLLSKKFHNFERLGDSEYRDREDNEILYQVKWTAREKAQREAFAVSEKLLSLSDW